MVDSMLTDILSWRFSTTASDQQLLSASAMNAILVLTEVDAACAVVQVS